MRIAILADTHLTSKKMDLPKTVIHSLKNVNCIIHCGDIKENSVLKMLERYGPVYAVYGNVDDEELTSDLDEKLLLDFEGYKIGVIHGHGNKGKTTDRVFEAFNDIPVDVILFGHSHQPMLQTRKGILMINPGSATARRREKKHSMVILHLGEMLHCEFIFF